MKDSNIDFFPSLISEKKFIDTVDKLTIYIEKKIDKENYENIFLKDTDNDKIKFIYASKGKLINNDNERNLRLFDGKIINVLLTEFMANDEDFGHYVLIENMSF